MPEQSADKHQTGSLAPSFRVLLVSKDNLFARIARTKLEGWGYSVRIEEDLAAAAQWCRVDPFNLVIVDFDLPDGGGERLCRELRETPRPDYLYLLAYGSPADKEHAILALEAGADSYTVKPLHPAELRLRLEQAGRILSANKALLQDQGTDLVTGLLGSQAFERVFAVLYAQCQRTGSTGSLMFVEVMQADDLRRRLGAPALDTIDAELARRLADVPRQSDIVTRLAPGRFCLLLTNTSSLQCHVVVQRIRQALQNLCVVIEGKALLPRMKISMTDFPAPTSTPSQLLGRSPSAAMAIVGPEDPLPDGPLFPTAL